MPRRKFKPQDELRHWHLSFCDKCGNETYYPPRGFHHYGCDGKLVDIKVRYPKEEGYTEYLARKRRMGL